MNLFPIQKPTLALSISEEALCLVSVKKTWRKQVLQEVRKVPLPRGMVKLSSVKPNLEHTEEFLNQLQTLVEPLRTPCSVALTLPDLCARTSVFDFSTFPKKKKEQMALVNWRFQQDLKLDTSQSRLAYTVYAPSSRTNSTLSENSDTVKVLGTTIRHDIIEQYEKLCLQVNLIPVSIGIIGLDVCDLFRTNLQDILEAEDQQSPSPSSGGMFIFVSSWGISFLAFHEGSPCFIRTKSIPIREYVTRHQEETLLSDVEVHSRATNGHEATAASSLSAPHSVLSDEVYSTDTAIKVNKEILATVQYYLETFPIGRTGTSRLNVFISTDLQHGHTLVPAVEEIHQALRAGGNSGLNIQLTKLSQPTLLNNQIANLSMDSAWSALPGYANLMVA